jgi:hypothetical protein
VRIRDLVVLLLFSSPAWAQSAQVAPPPPPSMNVPDWALPGSPTHKQVPPPADFHRASRTVMTPIGIFDGQTDVGAALVPGSSIYDPATRKYSVTSAGYNIWYQRDEFRFLWKKMSGDVSLAASVTWPDPTAFFDRKVALVIRQSLDDDSAEEVAAQHGGGMVHIAQRAAQGGRMHDMEFQSQSYGGVPGTSPDDLTIIHPARFGLEKKGDQFQLYVSWRGEPMHAIGQPEIFHVTGPFYVGIGFTSHMAATPLTAVVSDVVLENAAGKAR